MIITLLPKRHKFAGNSTQSILESVRQAGFNLPHSCRGGRCGSCKARLVSGAVQAVVPPPSGLTAEERERGEILLCQAIPLGDVDIEAREVVAVDQIEVKRLPVRVVGLHHWSADLLGIELQLPAVEPFVFRAGQYLDLILPEGQRRSYSIASPPHDAKTIELHIRKVNGGAFTEKLFEYLKPNALLHIEGPLGQFAADLVLDDEPLVMVAGGTGFAPIKSILRALLETRPTGPVRLYWGVRRVADAYDLEWLRRLQERFTNLTVVVAVSDEPTTQLGFRNGFVHDVLIADQLSLKHAKLIAAGPPVMLDALVTALPDLGANLKNLILDSQGARLSAAAQAILDQG